MYQSKLSVKIENFLKKNADPLRSVIFALSGGSDSLALLHLISKDPIGKKLPLHIAHVNHQWRKESTEEAKLLEDMVNRMGYPFHLETLDPLNMKGNLEARARESRLKFFKSLSNKFNAQAVILAHHADDQAETLFKKVLEGHSLPYLHGMQEVSLNDNTILWRPLLSFTKKEIVNWLSKLDITAFQDQTNFDPRFFRGLLRTKIFPQLNQSFGKEITGSLCRLANEAKELNDYLNEAISEPMKGKVKGPWGAALEFEKKQIHSFEKKYLIRRFCESEGYCIPRPLIDTIMELIEQRAANKEVSFGSRRLIIDRRWLFLINNNFNPWEGKLLLKEGKQRFGAWIIEMETAEKDFPDDYWMAVWQGRFQVTLPQGNYFLGLPKMTAPFAHTTLSKWWSDRYVPAFLRRVFPVVWDKDKVVHEFMTGKRRAEHSLSSLVKISLAFHPSLLL